MSEAARCAEDCRQLAKRFTTADQQRQKNARDDDHPPVATFAPGALVWLHVPPCAPGLSSKLLSNYHGPYRVVERSSPVNYVIEPLTPPGDRRRRGRDVVHVDRLKPYFDPLVPTC